MATLRVRPDFSVPKSLLVTFICGQVVEPQGSPARARRGPTVGPPRSPGRKDLISSKMFLDHLGCTDKRLWHAFSPY